MYYTLRTPSTAELVDLCLLPANASGVAGKKVSFSDMKNGQDCYGRALNYWSKETSNFDVPQWMRPYIFTTQKPGDEDGYYAPHWSPVQADIEVLSRLAPLEMSERVQQTLSEITRSTRVRGWTDDELIVKRLLGISYTDSLEEWRFNNPTRFIEQEYLESWQERLCNVYGIEDARIANNIQHYINTIFIVYFEGFAYLAKGKELPVDAYLNIWRNVVEETEAETNPHFFLARYDVSRFHHQDWEQSSFLVELGYGELAPLNYRPYRNLEPALDIINFPVMWNGKILDWQRSVPVTSKEIFHLVKIGPEYKPLMVKHDSYQRHQLLNLWASFWALIVSWAVLAKSAVSNTSCLLSQSRVPLQIKAPRSQEKSWALISSEINVQRLLVLIANKQSLSSLSAARLESMVTSVDNGYIEYEKVHQSGLPSQEAKKLLDELIVSLSPILNELEENALQSHHDKIQVETIVMKEKSHI